jgi:hypothetical protein
MTLFYVENFDLQEVLLSKTKFSQKTMCWMQKLLL